MLPERFMGKNADLCYRPSFSIVYSHASRLCRAAVVLISASKMAHVRRGAPLLCASAARPHAALAFLSPRRSAPAADVVEVRSADAWHRVAEHACRGSALEQSRRRQQQGQRKGVECRGEMRERPGTPTPQGDDARTHAHTR